MVSIASGIHDNHKRGPVGDFLFLFGEPGFIRSLDPEKTVTKFFKIVDEHLELAKRLKQKQVAKECAVLEGDLKTLKWWQKKVDDLQN